MIKKIGNPESTNQKIFFLQNINCNIKIVKEKARLFSANSNEMK